MHSFLIADLAGFTALTEAHGDERAADVAADFVDGMRRLLTRHEAQEVKTMGDAVLVHIGDATRAVCLAECAVGELGSRHGSLAVRIGVHTGPAVRRGADWFGATVNVAARVAAEAQRDEALLTDATVRSAGPVSLQANLTRLGERSLRNVRAPVVLHSLRFDAPAAAGLGVDPVCRMAVTPTSTSPSLTHDDETVVFCSTACALVFAASPELFAPRAATARRSTAG